MAANDGEKREKVVHDDFYSIHNYAHKFMTPKDISRHNHRSSNQPGSRHRHQHQHAKHRINACETKRTDAMKIIC